MNEQLVNGLNCDDVSGEMEFCESCVQGKIHRTPFQTGGGKQAEVPLGLVHSDVCGRINLKTLEYFFTFVDDKTRYVCVALHFKAQKSGVQVLSRMEVYGREVNRTQVNTLSSDNGGEYIEFQSYLKKEGIKHKLTVPISPEQNGVAERIMG